MPPTSATKTPPTAYTRRRNMKKLNRAGRARLKKRKEVIAAAEAKGEDVTEALRKAGLGDDNDKAKAKDRSLDNNEQDRHARDDDQDTNPTPSTNPNPNANTNADDNAKAAAKKAKAKKRIEQLKANRRQRHGQPHTHQPTPSNKNAELWAGTLSAASKSGTRNQRQVAPDAIHPSSPVPIASLERALTHRDTAPLADNLTVPPTVHGRPKVLFVSPSAMGALDCLKNCPNLHRGCPIAKLFAKHMKVPEQATYLTENPVNVALGTPNRLLKLATEGHLEVDGVGVVALDMRANAKKQSLVDIPDVANDFWGLWDMISKGGTKKDVQVLIVLE